MPISNRHVGRLRSLLCLSLSVIVTQSCMYADETDQAALIPEDVAGQVIPYPSEWIGYQELPAMRGKRLGIISHLFVREGSQPAARGALARVVDIAIQEPTCLVLKAAQSISDPSHFILYEEWADYDEFFTVQLNREYRTDFSAWLGPLGARPAAPEFFEIYHDAGDGTTAAGGTFAAISSTLAANNGSEELIRNEFIGLMDAAAEQPGNKVLVAHRSINDPNHFVLYEERPDFDELVSVELQRNDPERFSASLRELDAAAPTIEFFEIIYDPGKE